jgi:hypothetical protein
MTFNREISIKSEDSGQLAGRYVLPYTNIPLIEDTLHPDEIAHLFEALTRLAGQDGLLCGTGGSTCDV